MQGLNVLFIGMCCLLECIAYWNVLFIGMYCLLEFIRCDLVLNTRARVKCIVYWNVLFIGVHTLCLSVEHTCKG
jgi:hypothetical protein